MAQFYKLVLLFFFTFPAYGLTVSLNSNCDNGSIPYNFDKYSSDPDFTIEFSSYTVNPDFTFKEVKNASEADFVIQDNIDADFFVCKSNIGKTIAITNYEIYPDMIVNISRYGYFYDYTIFNSSRIVTTEEIISILLLRGFEDLE